MSYKIAIMALILLALLAVGFSCISAGNPAPRADLAVIKKAMNTDNVSGNVTVTVTIKNTGSNNAELAEVKVDFYDKDKNLIDSGRDSILNLGSGETWDFTIPCTSGDCSKIRSYDIQVTSGASSESSGGM